MLYYNINQYRDALDAYSRAIRINPYISEVWFDLGSLYESCNNQIADAIDAYARASDLDQNNVLIKQRLELLRNAQRTGGSLPAAPGPQDVHPTAYATVGPPTLLSGHAQSPAVNARHPHHMDSRGGPMHDSLVLNGGRDLPAPPGGNGGRHGSPESGFRHMEGSNEPFRGGPPPPLNLDDKNGGPGGERGGASHPSHPTSGRPPHSHRSSSSHTGGGGGALAPMDIDRPYVGNTIPPVRPGSSANLPLHHPQPQPQMSIGQMQQQQQQQQHANGGHHAQAHQTLPPMSSSRSLSRSRRSSGSGERDRSPPARGAPVRNVTPPLHGPSRGPAAQFSSQLPPPPSTHVNPAPYFSQPYATSNGSSTPSERERERERERDRERDRNDGWERRNERKRDASPPHPPHAHGHRQPPPGANPPASPYYQQQHGGYDSRRPSSPPPQSRDHREPERYRSPPYGPSQSRYDPRGGSPPYVYPDEQHHPRHHQQQPQYNPPTQQQLPPPPTNRRYDPRLDSEPQQQQNPPARTAPRRESWSEKERERMIGPVHQQPQQAPPADYPDRNYNATPDPTPQSNRRVEILSSGGRGSESRYRDSESPAPSRPPPATPLTTAAAAPEATKDKRRRGAKEKEDKPPKEKKERKTAAKKVKEDITIPPPSQESSVYPGSRRQRAAAASPAPAARGTAKKDSPTESLLSGRRSTLDSNSPPDVPRREVDEDYDDGVAETLIGLASSRPPNPPAPEPERPNANRGNSIASILLSAPDAGTSTSESSSRAPRTDSPKRPSEAPAQRSPPQRVSTPSKRPRSPSTTAAASSKRIRIEVLNPPTLLNPVAVASPQTASSNSPPPQSAGAQRLTPIPMASRTSSTHDTRMRSRSRSPAPLVKSPVQAPRPSERTSPVVKSPPRAPPAAAAPSQDPPLPSIATLSPLPPSPKALPSEAGEAESGDRARSEAASDMLMDSDQSRASSVQGVPVASSAKLPSPPAKLSSLTTPVEGPANDTPAVPDDVMAVDSPAADSPGSTPKAST